MSKNLIKKYSTSVIKDFIERANDLKELKHELTKGELKELFISRVLKSFFTFSIRHWLWYSCEWCCRAKLSD
jgi:hypothetical protein